MYCSKWVTLASATNGYVREKASDDKIVILEIEGECVLSRNGTTELCAIFLLQTKGELSLTIGEKSTVVLSQSFTDLHPSCHDIKTNCDFKGYVILAEQMFFFQAIENVRFKMSETFHTYLKEPSASLTEDETLNILQYVNTLAYTINKGEHHFRYEVIKNILQIMQFDLWNIILRMLGKGSGNKEYIWGNKAEDFLYLVFIHCRQHHEVRWYARQLGVSADALSAKLKKFYGKSARRLIDEALAADARLCLLEPENTVQKVSEMLCFSDQAAFNKFFKRCCGISPTAFKKRQQ